jgi:hypothetical protein
MQNLIRTDKGAVFVILPQRLGELDLIQQIVPDGELFNYLSPVNGRSLVTLYVVSPLNMSPAP